MIKFKFLVALVAATGKLKAIPATSATSNFNLIIFYSITIAIGLYGGQILLHIRFILQIVEQVIQCGDRHYRNAIVALHFLYGGKLALPALRSEERRVG